MADYCFEGCSGLTNIVIPHNVVKIEFGAFANCRSLSTVEISENIKYIMPHAFSGCSSLTSVTISNSVTTIGDYTFADCRSLASVIVGEGVTSISGSAFSGCSSLTSVTFLCPTVGKWFSNMASIKEVVLGESIATIDDKAFQGCSGLTSIASNAMTAPTISTRSFNLVGSNGTLYVPSGSSGYDTWMAALEKYNWTKVEQ